MRRALDDPLLRAWAALVALSLASTLAAVAVESAAAAPGLRAALGGAILAIAGLKARQIALRYLGLERAPFWRRGFGAAMWGFLALLLGLFLAG